MTLFGAIGQDNNINCIVVFVLGFNSKSIKGKKLKFKIENFLVKKNKKRKKEHDFVVKCMTKRAKPFDSALFVVICGRFYKPKLTPFRYSYMQLANPIAKMPIRQMANDTFV